MHQEFGVVAGGIFQGPLDPDARGELGIGFDDFNELIVANEIDGHAGLILEGGD